MKKALSLRARITLLFVLTVAGVGGILIAVMYAYLKLTPVPFEAVFPDDAAISGAVPVTDDILKVVLTVSLTTLAVLTVLAGAIGWFVAGWAITPLTGIAQSARQVTAGNLDQRTGYAGANDEVGDLANALDTMLDSLAASIASQQRFSANASHELKTPIATIQTVADVALAPEAGEDEMRAALSQIRTVNARSSETVSALLDLARAQTPNVSVFDLADALPVSAITSTTDTESSHGDAPVTVAGDPVLIRQAVDNLLRNAHAHGTEGTTQLRLFNDANTAVIEVSNGGPELSAEQLNQLKEPFARGANRVAGPGHGLGLALVDAIATSHHGYLDLTPRRGGGVIARLSLPGSAHPAPGHRPSGPEHPQS
ncbi:sensor histidine kinase [Corynebacterium sp. 20_84]